MQNRNRDIDIKNSMDTKVGGRVWDDLGGWDGYRYTLLCIKYITKENQLYTAQGTLLSALW